MVPKYIFRDTKMGSMCHVHVPCSRVSWVIESSCSRFLPDSFLFPKLFLDEVYHRHVGDPRDQLKSVVYGVLVLGSGAGCPVGR